MQTSCRERRREVANRGITLAVCIVISLVGDARATDFASSAELLSSTSSVVRALATETLEKKEAVPTLLDHLEALTGIGAAQAIDIISRIGDPGDANLRRIAAMVQQKSPFVKSHFLSMLRNVGTPGALQILEEIGTDSAYSDSLRGVSVAYVAQIDALNARAYLRSQAASDIKDISLSAWDGLAFYLNDKGGKSVAERALNDPRSTSHQRALAITVLGSIGEESSRANISRIAANDDGEIKDRALRALKHIELTKLPARERSALLESSLKDSSKDVRDWAIGELWLRHDEDTQEIVRRALRTSAHPAARDIRNLARALRIK